MSDRVEKPECWFSHDAAQMSSLFFLQETHIIHTFGQDFYGSNLKIVMLKYIRPMKDFKSLGKLTLCKIPKFLDTQNIPVITLKFKQIE